MRTTLDTYRTSGNNPFLKHTLNRCIKYGMIIREATFKKYDGIVSTPADFLLFSK